MEDRIKERFSDPILAEAASRYGIGPGAVRKLDGFESFIFEFEKGGASFILRIAHSFRRSEGLIKGEIDWINHLAARGAAVARAIPSERGRLVESIPDSRGESFLATAFVKAQGRPPREFGWTPELHETYGRALGKLHKLTRGYAPPDPSWRRMEWDDPLMLYVDQFLPAGDEEILERYHDLLSHLRSLPRDDDSYGLVHQDAHGGNLFIDDAGRITFFDFDDCAYSWFWNDIAIVLFYAARTSAGDAAAFTEGFLPRFLKGYAEESPVDERWFKEIPHFLKLREMDLYAVVHRSFDVENLTDPWCLRFMEGRRESLIRGAPVIDFDFESLG
jgi:Ser/Thr protein kinase RdoA (MazF antagonist)